MSYCHIHYNDYFCNTCIMYCCAFYFTGAVLYIRWGNNACPAGETNVHSGHIVESSNANDANGDYLCLPDAHNAYPPQTQAPLLNSKDVTDSYGKTVPCVACLASGRSTVFTFPDNIVCPHGWTAEYVGYEAANPKWPGQNLCVDTYLGDKLSQAPCNNLAVIAKGPLNAYSYAPQNVVSCAVCSI